MKKLNLSDPVDETVDLFMALTTLITISLAHQITNNVMARYCNNSTMNLHMYKPSTEEATVKQRSAMSGFDIIKPS